MEHKREFEFGDTEQANAFFDRNPKFYPAFERLMSLANKCFGRLPKIENQMQDICFSVGHTCREDYIEVLFLAVNGYATGAQKLVRGLYERAVVLAYIIKHPEKAERFLRFAAIQEYKLLNAALQVTTEEEFDRVATPLNSAAQIREMYEKVKPEFQVTQCSRCKATGTAFSWDTRDVPSMVHDVGDDYKTYYLGGYALPNLHIHATLANAMKEFNDPDQTARVKRHQYEADYTLMHATALLVLVIRSQDTLFALGLDKDLEQCDSDFREVFLQERRDENSA
jgi:hypothetical protein